MRSLLVVAVALGCGRIGFTDEPARVQTLAPGFGSATTVSVPIAQRAGDLLVGAVYWHFFPETITLTDKLGLVWSALPIQSIPSGCSLGSDGNSTEVQLWYAPIAVTGDNVVTLAQSVGIHPIGMFLLEYSGLSNVVDASSGRVAAGPGNAMSVPPLAATGLDVIVALFNDPLGVGTMGGGSGYTVLGRDLGFYTMVEDQIVPAGTYTPDGTLPPARNDACWAGTAAAFRAQ